MAEAVAERTFYSNKAALTISPGGKFKALKGKYEDVGGTKERVGEHIIQFVPIGQTKCGQFTTDDPELIAFLEWRSSNIGDVFGPDKYYEESTPQDIQIAELKRKLTQTNSLIETLQRQGKQVPNR